MVLRYAIKTYIFTDSVSVQDNIIIKENTSPIFEKFIGKKFQTLKNSLFKKYEEVYIEKL